MASTQPPIEDPIRPSEVVGALSLADLGPLGRAPLRLAFIAAAVITAIGRAALIRADGVPLEMVLFSVVASAGAVLVVVLPVALLWRIPDARRSHGLLLAGLGVGAAIELVRLASQAALAGGGPTSVGSALETATWLATPVGTLLVGLGLLRLRPAGPARRGLAVVIAVLFLVLALMPVDLGLMAGGGIAPVPFVLNSIIAPSAAGFTVWVAVDAWLAREEPRAFWTLIAAALPIQVIAALLGLAMPIPAFLIAPSDPQTLNVVVFVSATVGALLVFSALAMAALAYAKFTPAAERS